MRQKIKSAIKETVQDLVDSGVRTSFTEKELNKFGITFRDIKITPDIIKKIRKKSNYSQSVFARLLNVSISSVRQREQGSRTPAGSAKVLLEVMEKEPHILDYRIKPVIVKNRSRSTKFTVDA